MDDFIAALNGLDDIEREAMMNKIHAAIPQSKLPYSTLVGGDKEKFARAIKGCRESERIAFVKVIIDN